MLAAMPVVMYFTLVIVRMANVPYMDDYYDILLTFLFMHESQSASEFAQGLFWQFHQHMVVYDRLVYLLYALLLDTVDLRVFILIGNLGLLAYGVALCYRVDSSRAYLLPCLTALVFSLYHEEQTFWAMAAVQQFTIMAFTVVAFMLLDGEKKSIVGAVLIAALALFTQSNEALILPLGFCLLLDDYWRNRHRQNLVHLAQWSALCVVILLPFLWLNHADAKQAVLDESQILHGYAAATAIAISFFASLVSLPFTVGDPVGIAACVGAMHAVLLVYLMRKGWRHDRVVVCLMVFCLLSLAAASLMRTPYYGPTAYVSRYKIFCTTLICGEMILASRLFSGTFRWRYLLLALAVALNLQSYYKNFGYAEHTQVFRTSKLVEWFYTGTMSDFPFAANIIDDAYEAGMYTPDLHMQGVLAPLAITRVDSCPDSAAPWVPSPAVIARSAAESRGVMLVLHKQVQAAPPPDTVWLCGETNYQLTVRNSASAELPVLKNGHGFLLLEKKQFVAGRYRLLFRRDTQGFSSAGVVDMQRDMHAVPADCQKFRQFMAAELPVIYRRYCPPV